MIAENGEFCRVCGLAQEDFQWGRDGVSPTYNICNCCGVEFGYEDITIQATKIFRDKWIANGCIWFNPRKKPVGWSFDKQRLQIPIMFR